MWTYVPAVISFLIAIVGVAGKSTRDGVKGISSVTPFGWILAALAALSLAFTVQTLRDARYVRETSRCLAVQELVEADNRILEPYVQRLPSYWTKDRFTLAASLLDDGIPDEICSIDINADAHLVVEPNKAGIPPKWVFPNVIWGTLLSRSASQGLAEIDEVISRYSSFLDAKTLAELQSLRNSRWLQFWGSWEQKNRYLVLPENRPSVNLCGKEQAQKSLVDFLKLASEVEVDLGDQARRCAREGLAPDSFKFRQLFYEPRAGNH